MEDTDRCIVLPGLPNPCVPMLLGENCLMVLIVMLVRTEEVIGAIGSSIAILSASSLRTTEDSEKDQILSN